MKNFFECEFFYRSTEAEHMRQLRVIETALTAVTKNSLAFRTMDLDDGSVVLPDGIPGIPCLHRLSPAPERIILGPLKTQTDVWRVMGIAMPDASHNADRFTGWGTNK